jgi:hypothetical protein
MNPAILDNPGVLQALFHPRIDDSYHSPSTRIVSARVEDGIHVGGRLYPAQPDSPAILYYHGNGEIAADYDMIAEMYTRMGISLLVMDYRGYGTSEGYPTASNLVNDATPVFNATQAMLAGYDLSPSRIYVMGRSLGSVPAIETALHHGDTLAGLIIESGFSDTFGLLARLGAMVQDADEEADGFGNSFKMARITIPTLILHGQNDFLIPPSDAEELYQRCTAPVKRMVRIQGAGHNDIMLVGMTQYFAAIRMFVVEPEL